jgi:hypothetical protein
MSRIDTPSFKHHAALKLYFNTTPMNWLVYIFAMIITLAPYLSGAHWGVCVCFTGIFIGYHIRCYLLGKTYLEYILKGALINKIPDYRLVRMLDRPLEFTYDLKMLHDSGRSL